MAASIKPTPVHELKQRVFTCIDRLADRDTLAQATAELHLIARSLSPETALSPFLSCLLSVDAAHKASVRVHSLRLIATLAAAHRDHLAPHVPKILSSSLLRRIRDPDTAVRSACSDASSSLARYVSGSPFKVILEPLLAALLIEQDYNAQIGSAMCLSAAIESSESVEAIDLRRTLPKMVKLVRSESFRAKSALLGLIGSVVAADGGEVVNGPGLMGSVVSCATELLCSDDWAVRKAAAEALHKVAVAVARRELLVEAKVLCVNTLENRKFDKVKIAREAMNRSLEAWKEVNCLSDEDSPSSRSKSSTSKDESSRDSLNFSFETPQSKQNLAKSGSPLSDCSTITDSPPSSKCSDDHSYETPQLKKTLFKSRSYRRSPKNGIGVKSNLQPGRKSVAKKPLDLNQLVRAHTEEVYDNDADFVELSLIRKQLFQIETQQSYLMELLQTLMGTSQSAINSLETRVSGLETALGGIYHGLAVQNGRIQNEYAGSSGCTVPGADFTTPEFQRRNEGGYFATLKPCGSGSSQILPLKEGNVDRGETRGIPTRDSSRDSGRKVEVELSTRARLLEISQRRPCSGGSLDGASPVTYNAPMFQRTQNSR